MSEAFQTQVDIANRALQHCGAARIVAFTDDSKNASETAFVYDKVRRAELRRNVWRHAVRKAVLRPLTLTTLKINPAPYNPVAVYLAGSIVSFGNIWWITFQTTQGATPGVFPGPWDVYFGPKVADVWNPPSLTPLGQPTVIPGITAPTAYFAGDLVYEVTSQDGTTFTGSLGLAEVFMSVVNNNSAEPLLYSAYSSTTTYGKTQVVQFGGFFYMSLIDFNTGNEPDLSPQPWQSTITYSATNTVAGSDGYQYKALATTTGSDPTLDGGVHWANTNVLVPWTPTFAAPTASGGWLRLQVSLTDLNIVYPIGAGPTQQIQTRNIYMLPHGYLKEAPQDPKAGSTSYLGAPSGRMYDDWEFENDYFITRETEPIIFRFVADVQDVGKFDDMFAEGLAARIAMEVCEPLTQSGAKLQAIGQMYKVFMSEARTVNGIEEGPTQPPLDDYIACRI